MTLRYIFWLFIQCFIIINFIIIKNKKKYYIIYTTIIDDLEAAYSTLTEEKELANILVLYVLDAKYTVSIMIEPTKKEKKKKDEEKEEKKGKEK